MIKMEDIAFAAHKAQQKFYARNPKFSSKNLKGRNHIKRTVVISNLVSIVLSKNTKPELSTELSGGYMAGYMTIYPTEFVELLAEELELPVSLLVNSVNV